jgi:hypothetical protein
MSGFHYRYHGLQVLSATPLPEWSEFETESGYEPDVVISIGTGALRDSPSRNEHLFSVKKAGSYLVRQGCEIVVFPEELPISRRLRLFLTGSAWGVVLYQRGRLPLHASGVQVGDGAVLFCGPRGQGKSTLAALLTERNYRLVSDDLCCIEVSEAQGPSGADATTGDSGIQPLFAGQTCVGTAKDRHPVVHPSVPRFKLWSDSIRELGWDRVDSLQDEVRSTKFHYLRPLIRAARPLPVRAIYILSWGEVGFKRLTGFEALKRLFHGATWREDLLLAGGDPARHLCLCSELCRRVPIMEFSRPRDFQAIPVWMDLLVCHMSDSPHLYTN